MSDVAHEIRTALPETEEILVQYLGGLYEDPDEEYEDILYVTRGMLESYAVGYEKAFDDLIKHLGSLLSEKIDTTKATQRPSLTKLDRVMEMNKTISNTLALEEGVDMSSINKSK